MTEHLFGTSFSARPTVGGVGVALQTETAARPECLTFFAQTVAGGVWTNMPAALTEFAGAAPFRARRLFDLTLYTQARMVASLGVAGAANAELRAQYSTDGGTTWLYLDGADGPKVNISALMVRSGAWVNLATGAKADAQLRIVGINGDGVLDPNFGIIDLQLR